MKFLRILPILFAIVCAMPHSAFGDDFKQNILDPVTPATGFTVNTIFSNSFTVNFTACGTGELPAGVATPDGCFAGQNDSGQTWTSLEMNFLSNGSTMGQSADCTPAAGASPFVIFGDAVCTGTGAIGTPYVLTFSEGSIPTNDGIASIFFITETGVSDPNNFPTEDAVANTPEPDSLVLFLTGTIMAGLYLSRRRLFASTLG